MRHLLVCLPLPTAAQTKSEHFTFAERQALRFGTDAMSRTTLILVTFVLATGCGDSGNPVGPSPTSIPNVEGTYSGSVTATIMLSSRATRSACRRRPSRHWKTESCTHAPYPCIALNTCRHRFGSAVNRAGNPIARGPVRLGKLGCGATARRRFEQTAELSQFAALVDEHGEGVSPTLSAGRVYREHRAAGRRGTRVANDGARAQADSPASVPGLDADPPRALGPGDWSCDRQAEQIGQTRPPPQQGCRACLGVRRLATLLDA